MKIRSSVSKIDSYENKKKNQDIKWSYILKY